PPAFNLSQDQTLHLNSLLSGASPALLQTWKVTRQTGSEDPAGLRRSTSRRHREFPMDLKHVPTIAGKPA
ncbi:MAG: hypothetical protein ACOYMI_10405, partial [Phycisphaerales bacterium]